jgi:transcription initiation factor TFIIIB Brf1 subunit/transcription initiation factor TFIIB
MSSPNPIETIPIETFCSECGKQKEEYTFKNNNLICKDCWLVIYGSKKAMIEK